MKIISNSTWDEYQALVRQRQRLAQAHRWLSEYDEFLSPLWKFIFHSELIPSDISEVREDMRKRWRAFNYSTQQSFEDNMIMARAAIEKWEK
jgi:hypothetical protein